MKPNENPQEPEAKSLFERLQDHLQAKHPNLPWGELTCDSSYETEQIAALLTFLEANDVDVLNEGSGVLEPGTETSKIRENPVDLRRTALLKALFWVENAELLGNLSKIGHPVVQNLMSIWLRASNNPTMQIRGQNLTEASLIYRCFRGALAYSDEFQNEAENQLADELKKLAQSNAKRRAEKERIALSRAENFLSEHAVQKPADLAALEAPKS